MLNHLIRDPRRHWCRDLSPLPGLSATLLFLIPMAYAMGYSLPPLRGWLLLPFGAWLGKHVVLHGKNSPKPWAELVSLAWLRHTRLLGARLAGDTGRAKPMLSRVQ